MSGARGYWKRIAGLVLVLCTLPGVTRAQPLVDVSVTGATEEGRGLLLLYKNQAQTPPWTVVSSLLRVYRLQQTAGMVTIRAVLNANSAPRVAQGPASQQQVRIHTTQGDVTLASAQGSPDQDVQVEYTFTGTGMFGLTTKFYAALCGLDEIGCGAMETRLLFIDDTPHLQFGGNVRPRLFQGRPPYFQMTFGG